MDRNIADTNDLVRKDFTADRNRDLAEDMLVALRRVMRAVDLHSRWLVPNHGLTGPQAMMLKEVVRARRITGGELAKRVTLSQATVTDIVKRLEWRQLLQRKQAEEDRRRVYVQATEAGGRFTAFIAGDIL